MKILTIISLAAFSLTACDSKQEEVRKEQIENRADKLEEAAASTRKAAEGDAEVIKKQGEAQAEALKKEAERTREQK